MVHKYDEMYVDDAMRIMGEMMDYVANYCNVEMDHFFTMFINSGIATFFEMGHPRYITGVSGIELAWIVLEKMNINVDYSIKVVDYEYSSQYWCGWIMAYYQWYSSRTFSNIVEAISFLELERLYSTLHEASELKCVEVIDKRVRSHNDVIQLQRLRRLCGYSQRMLAEKAGVNLRTLQQYETGAKNINNASFKTIVALSRVLGCDIEELYEYEALDLDN